MFAQAGGARLHAHRRLHQHVPLCVRQRLVLPLRQRQQLLQAPQRPQGLALLRLRRLPQPQHVQRHA